MPVMSSAVRFGWAASSSRTSAATQEAPMREDRIVVAAAEGGCQVVQRGVTGLACVGVTEFGGCNGLDRLDSHESCDGAEFRYRASPAAASSAGRPR